MHDKIIPTADLISYFRIFSDTPYVKEIAEMTSAESLVRQMLGGQFDNSNYLAVMSEARFKKINLCVQKYKNIIELAVGRSPRDLILTEDKTITYVATDLPDSLTQHKVIIEKIMGRHGLSRPNLHFFPTNALNLEDLKEAIKFIPSDPIAIISEGMLMYFSMEEKKKFFDNLQVIFSERKGVFITSDLIVTNWQKTSSAPMLSKLADTTGRDMRSRNFSSEEEIKIFLENAGLKHEDFNPEIEITSIKELRLENDVRSQRMAHLPIRIIYLAK
jgi:hypothetical protein